jgi:hypothetical protein
MNTGKVREAITGDPVMAAKLPTAVMSANR